MASGQIGQTTHGIEAEWQLGDFVDAARLVCQVLGPTLDAQWLHVHPPCAGHLPAAVEIGVGSHEEAVRARALLRGTDPTTLIDDQSTENVVASIMDGIMIEFFTPVEDS